MGVCGFLWHLLISRHRPSGPNRRRNRVSRHRRSGLRLGLGAKAAQGLRRSSRSDSCEAAATWANGPKERRRRRRARNPRARALQSPPLPSARQVRAAPLVPAVRGSSYIEAYMGPVAAFEQNRQQPASCVCCSMGGHRHSFNKHLFALRGLGWCWHDLTSN